MRTFRVLVLAALAAGSLTVLAPSASASAPASAPAASAKLVKFCKAVAKISSSTPSNDDSAAAAQLAKTTRNAAKLALTSKIASALRTMADYYEAIGNAGNNPAKVAAALKNIRKFTKASAVFTGYYIANCSTIES
jgi:hypothetical protein